MCNKFINSDYVEPKMIFDNDQNLTNDDVKRLIQNIDCPYLELYATYLIAIDNVWYSFHW